MLLAFSMLVVFLVLAAFYESWSIPLAVMLVVPLGIIGASLGLNVADKPFGFVALLGLIALAGMIMRNAVILVDQIESDVTHGLTRREAIVEATVRRARPVVLTALAAILAMIPLSRSAFWGPMATTIMGGLFVVEAVSVMLQVGWYKKTKKRIFLMAPIHHHYEQKGWKETQVVVRFWIITMMLVLVGLSTLKLR